MRSQSHISSNNLEALDLPEWGWRTEDEVKEQAERRRTLQASKDRIPLRGLALYCIGRDNLYRRGLYDIVTK